MSTTIYMDGAENAVPAAMAGKQAGKASKRVALGNLSNLEQKRMRPAATKATASAAQKSTIATRASRRQTRASRTAKTKKRTTSTSAVAPSLPSMAAAMEEDVPVLAEEQDAAAALAAMPERTVRTSALPAGIDDIDTADLADPQHVVEYIDDIMSYIRDLEVRMAVPAGFLAHQPEIDANVRSILVDWMVEVHYQFELIQETLFLAVSIVDRFLSMRKIKKTNFQLTGITALFIAAKYEEMCPPSIFDFSYICEDVCNEKDILQMEGIMLKTLDFSLGQPLSLHFLRRYSKAGFSDVKLHTIGKYVIELSLGSEELVSTSTSLVAAGALFLARTICKEAVVWNKNLEHYSGYTAEDLSSVVSMLLSVLKNAPTNPRAATHNKFSTPQYYNIANLADITALCSKA